MSREHQLQLNSRKSLLYLVVAGALRIVCRLYFRPVVRGVNNLPTSGAVLVAPTHRSNLDFAFTLFMSRRKVFFMAKESLFRVPVLGGALVQLGAFPVARGAADREAMKAAEAVLAAGHALIMFPEGTRQQGQEILPLHDGTMFIASRCGASVLPVGIAGTEDALPSGAKIPRPRRVSVVIGEPISPVEHSGRASRTEIAAQTKKLRDALQDAYDKSLSIV